MKSPVIKRSIVIASHKTSVSLEDAFWSGLKEIAGVRGSTLSGLVDAINTERHHGNLSSTIRLFVLDHFRAQADASRAQASHRDLPVRGAASALDLNGAGGHRSSHLAHVK
jgi:predicted DNA-binding ribbon-helix-helix protein